MDLCYEFNLIFIIINQCVTKFVNLGITATEKNVSQSQYELSINNITTTRPYYKKQLS